MSEWSGSWGARYLSIWLVWIVRRPLPVVITVAALTLISAIYAGATLGVNTDPVEMLDESLPFRATYDRYREEFPNQARTILVILEAPTPEQAHDAANKISQGMLEHEDLFPAIDWPQGDAYFQSHGLLFRDIDTLNRLGNRLSAAQPLLARLNADPSLAGLMNLLAEAHNQAEALGMDLSEMDAAVARSIHGTLAGRYTPLSWQSLLSGREREYKATPELFRETLIVRPALDFGRVRAGREALDKLRELRLRLGYHEGPVRMYLTGSVALADDELNSVIGGASKAGLMSVVLVALVMWFGLRSTKQVAIALVTLASGLLITAGIAAALVGRINLVSVAFTVLYVGLGVNYAIHYLLRYRELCLSGMSLNLAVITAGVGLRGALVLSALTTAIGFAAFIPTQYKGVAELGLIAAFAMLVTLVVSYSLLPALMAMVGVRFSPASARGRAEHAGSWLDLPQRHASRVRWTSAVLAVLAGLTATQVSFDSDPLNLRDPEAESVTTLRTLLNERATGHRNLQVLTDSEEAARKLSEQLNDLPEVERVINLFDFLPDQQEEKLILLDDLNWLMGPELLNADFHPQDRPAAEQQAAVERLRTTLENSVDTHVKSALYSALEDLNRRYAETGDEALYNEVGHKLLDLLPLTMERLRAALSVEGPITLESMPDQLRQRWLSEEGSYLIQVFPATNATDVSGLTEFVTQVQSVVPNVTGAPVIQLVSGRSISSAFRGALLWALVGITLLLLVLLQSFSATFKVLTPLVLGGLITVALMVVLEIPFNYANVVALPLLFGVGVDNGIHLVYRHRAGQMPGDNVLRTATARGIIFGALTTALSFGNLAFSSHTGTASMGKVLAMGLALIVLTTLIVLPAMLHRSRR